MAVFFSLDGDKNGLILLAFAFWALDELLGAGERGIWGILVLKVDSGCLLLTRFWRIFWALKLLFGAKNGFIGLFEIVCDVFYLGELYFFSKVTGFVFTISAVGLSTFWTSFKGNKVYFWISFESFNYLFF